MNKAWKGNVEATQNGLGEVRKEAFMLCKAMSMCGNVDVDSRKMSGKVRAELAANGAV